MRLSVGKRAWQRRGQTALETAFVFTMLLFMTFSVMNLGILLHTKFMATYAAFMAGRSFQVLGDGTGTEFFQEVVMKDSSLLGDAEVKRLMEEMEQSKYPAFVRVAEDIFTCGLAWMNVPEGDKNEAINPSNQEDQSVEERCMSGKRKYETLNIGMLSFAPFNPADDNAFRGGDDKRTKGLEAVIGAYAEPGREPLRYGILRLPYRTPLLFDPFKQFAGQYHQGEVFVPVLLNPGLKIQLEEDRSGDSEKAFENSSFKNDPSADAGKSSQSSARVKNN